MRAVAGGRRRLVEVTLMERLTVMWLSSLDSWDALDAVLSIERATNPGRLHILHERPQTTPLSQAARAGCQGRDSRS